MPQDDVDEMIQEALKYGERAYTQEALGPYYKRFGYEDDPFKIPRIFVAPSQKLVIEKISQYVGGSKNRIDYNIAVIGPKWIGKTILLKKIHQNAKIRGYNGKFLTGNKLLKKFKFEEDGYLFHKTLFEKLLNKITDRTDYIIMSQTDLLEHQIFYYLEEVRKQTEFTSLIVTLFDLVTWNLLPFSGRDIFKRTLFLCPITIEESKSLLLNYLEKPDQGQKSPFTQEAVDTLTRFCWGSPGLLVDLAQKSMQLAHLIREDSITKGTVRQAASDNFFKGVEVLKGASESFETSSRKDIIELMLAHKKPLTSTQIAEKMELTRQTIGYHLGEMLKQDIALKKPKKGKEAPYQISPPSRIAFEHRMLKRCLNEWRK